MRLRGAVSVSPFLLASSIAARSAILFTPHSSLDKSASTELSPSAAALVLLQRAGLSQDHHSVQNLDQNTLQAINTFGLPPTLFGDDYESSTPSFTIVLEGVQDPKTFVDRRLSRHIVIENPPSSESTTPFVQELHAAQGTSVTADDASCHLDNPSALLDCVRASLNVAHGRRILHHTKLSKYGKSLGVLSAQYKNASQALSQQITELISTNNMRADITVLLTPFQEPSSGFIWRSPAKKWMDDHNLLYRRQDADWAAGHADTDALASSSSSSSSSTSTSSTSTTSSSSTSASATATSAPLGILPACYATESACTSTTHSCSGHGKCTRKYTIEEDRERSCWSCSCESERNDNGKVTVWAGPACQKKDVSAPFWLLTGAVVGLVSAVAWGLGLLYSMGSEELPSVLAAGVGGASARK